jgi:hypothetical protein
MGIVRFALRFPHTFYVLAALILFLGIAAIRSMPTATGVWTRCSLLLRLRVERVGRMFAAGLLIAQ